MFTIDPATRAPRRVYKYVGLYLFTDPDPALTYELAKSEIVSFFDFLNPLNLTLSKYVRLVNLKLVPRLQYSLMAHPLEQSQLKQLQNIIWRMCHSTLIRKNETASPGWCLKKTSMSLGKVEV